MFPMPAADGVEEQESVAKSLLEKLGCTKSSRSAMKKGAAGKVT